MDTVVATRPLTSSGHIFRKDIQPVSTAMETLLRELYTTGAEVQRPKKVASSLSAAMGYLAHGVEGKYPTRLLFLETRGGHTVVYNNAWLSRGWYEMAFSLTKALQTEDVFFRSQPNTIRRVGERVRGRYGSFQLIRLDRGDVVRSISLVNDGGRWVFTTQGDAAPFEKTDRYHLPRKSERFSQALLEQYLRAMGLDPFHDAFYVVDDEHPGVGIDITISREVHAHDFLPITLDAVRETHGPFD